eukprot:scaffold8701_cov120-Isochrysis_galbana.AAC.8
MPSMPYIYTLQSSCRGFPGAAPSCTVSLHGDVIRHAAQAYACPLRLRRKPRAGSSCAGALLEMERGRCTYVLPGPVRCFS